MKEQKILKPLSFSNDFQSVCRKSSPIVITSASQVQPKSWFPLSFRMALDEQDNLEVGSLKGASSSVSYSDDNESEQEGEFDSLIVD